MMLCRPNGGSSHLRFLDWRADGTGGAFSFVLQWTTGCEGDVVLRAFFPVILGFASEVSCGMNGCAALSSLGQVDSSP